MTLLGCAGGQCPECGGIGTIPDGVYSITEELLRLIKTAALNLQDVRLLRDILQRARLTASGPENIATEIRRKVPRASSLADKLTRPDFLVVILGVMVAVIQTWVGYQAWKHPVSPPPAMDPAEILHRVAVSDTAAPRAKGQTIRRSSPKLRRNDRCSCGSGKKVKNCHRGGR